MINIGFAKKEDLKQIADLSKMFEYENCCNGIKADTEMFFENKTRVNGKKPCEKALRLLY